MNIVYSVLKGIIICILPWIILSGLYIIPMKIFPGGSVDPIPTAYAVMLAGIIGAFCLLTGAICGLIAGCIQTRRRLKLILCGIIVYWFDALIIAVLLTLATDQLEIVEKITGALWLGSVGALIFGIFVIPVIIIAALILEYWTRQRR